MGNLRDKVILYPSPGMGHFLPMVELARLLVSRNHNLDVTILVLRQSSSTTLPSLVSSVIDTNPLISFHLLPPVDLSDMPKPAIIEHSMFELVHRSKPHVEVFMSSLRPQLPLAFVVDFFCAGSTHIATQLGVPGYIFFTCCAASLGVLLHLPTVHCLTTQSFKDMGSSAVHFPGIPPIPADHLPTVFLNREHSRYQAFLFLSELLADADGMIINTFDSLEAHTVRSLRSTGAFTGPIYSIGPVIMSRRGEGGKGEGDPCFKWLDMQPKRSVVFLCFGSMGTFSPDQLKEIAAGLEGSQLRFLWVVNNPDQSIDLDFLLPKGFLDRTQDRGVVVDSWVPQVEVLRHEAVGCFVTHLGWNSVLEAITAGVRMIGWPLYAEQKMNKVFVADDMKLAIPMEGCDKDLVTAEEVERTLRKMMVMEEESDAVKLVKERCSAMRDAAAKTVGDEGASTLALDQLVRDWRKSKDISG